MMNLRLLTRKVVSLVSLGSITLWTSPTYGQFKKYQSKTKFNKSNVQDPNSVKEVGAPGTGTVDTKPEDIFGRGSGVKGTSKLPKDGSYVNLNPETAFGPEVITSFDFPDVSLEDLTKHMQKLTGINLIMDKGLKGKVSIIAPTPITVGDAWKAFLTALNMNGYSLMKSGAFYKIINARDVRYTPTKIYTGTYTPETENYVMRIIPLKNISTGEITRSFRPFMSRYGRIIDIKQTNTIIIHDTGANINRLVRLIKFLDVPGHEESLQIIKVKHSSAQEIAKLIEQILSNNQKGRNRSSSRSRTTGEVISKIIAEPRTNSIIALANLEGIQRLRGLVKKLDVRNVDAGSGKVHVYYLNYSDAETVSKTLTSLTANSGQAKSSRFSKNQSAAATLFTDQVKVTADKENNALVISASPTDYLTLKAVIKKLDIPRDQVFVEGLIMETTVNRNRAFGISIVGAYGSGAAKRAGFTGGSGDLLNLLQNNITSLGGLFVGGATGSKVDLDIGGSTLSVNSVNGLITAIAQDNNTNVLATPQILALDNVDATFEVGETVPVPEATNAANGATTTSISEQKIALTLKITPQINKVTRFVKLKIDQKIEDFSGRNVPNATGGVATTTRSAVTTVVVRDRDTIAMGGLMRDKTVNRVNKVPLLGDIPVLGWLFRRSEKETEKVSLLFFLTPRILSNYGKHTARTLKDVLNRRSIHMKNVVGSEDPFIPTLKGLYNKAQKQEDGPLYDVDEASKYLRENEQGGIGTRRVQDPNGLSGDRNATFNEEQTPNYQQILKNLENKTPLKGEIKTNQENIEVDTTQGADINAVEDTGLVGDEIFEGSDRVQLDSAPLEEDMYPEPAANAPEGSVPNAVEN